ncbi:MAG: hypothetical protein Q7V63_07680 [Gammaproteobacteria bacterium]|nr:hypothetical protein [Gammaproteobacteria bacterium]
MKTVSLIISASLLSMALLTAGCHSTSPIDAQLKPSTQAPADNSISLDLGSPSRATIYQGDKVIAKISYAKPGLYIIDTSSYPNGSYKLVVQTSGKTAQFVLHQSLVFTKPGKINAKISLR